MLASKLDNELVLKARVHSIFNNACNLITYQNDFIAILNSDKKIYPMSVVIDGKGNFDFKMLNIAQGMEFILHKERIYNPNTGFCIDVSKAERWNSEPDLNFNPIPFSDIERNIISLEKGIDIYGKFSFISTLVTSIDGRHFNTNIRHRDVLEEKYKFIFERFYEFIDFVIQNDIDEIPYSSKKLIGLGVGLTPSMDDFISGLMMSLVYLSKYYGFAASEAYNLNSQIIREGLKGTTRVSSEMLTFSSLGKGSELVKSLILSLLSETKEYIILQKVKEVTAIGETSGTDTAFGVYVGFKIANNIKFDSKKNVIYRRHTK